MGTIWSEAQLNQWGLDAEQEINKDVQCVFEKCYLATTAGISLYTLPSYIRSLRRVTWLAKMLDPVSWEEMTQLTPATVVLNPPNQIFNEESTSGTPLYYAMYPVAPYTIRLYPTPSLSLPATGGNPYATLPNEQFCALSYWREIDQTLQNPAEMLPPYVDRRMRKAYILWKAYGAEGQGQNLKASEYYGKKYQFLIDRFRLINNGCFVGKKYQLGDGELEVNNFRYPRPTLNPNFERVIF
jgi:hypothetical protein